MGARINLFGLRKDRTEFPVDIMLKPIRTPQGVLTTSFVRDMTEQRAAMETVRRQDQQFRSIVEAVHDFSIGQGRLCHRAQTISGKFESGHRKSRLKFWE